MFRTVLFSILALAVLAATSARSEASYRRFDFQDCARELLSSDDPYVKRAIEREDSGQNFIPDYKSINVGEVRDVFSLFERLFRTNIYAPSLCGTNIRTFLMYAKELRLSLDGAQVIILSPGMVWPLRLEAIRARDYMKRQWDFHVVLLFQGKVIDFDYASYPKPLPVNEYFERMFGYDPKNPGKVGEYWMEFIPAHDYINRKTDGPSAQVKADGTPLEPPYYLTRVRNYLKPF